MKVYQRKFKGGDRWACDIHVTPAGEQKPQRFRLLAPPSVTSKSGAERWARAQFTAIATQGPPPGSKRAKAKAADLAAQAERERVPTLGEWWLQYTQTLAGERRKPSGQVMRQSIFDCWLSPFAGLDLRACCDDLVVRRLRAAIAASPKQIGARHSNGIVTTLLACLRRASVDLPQFGLTVPKVKAIRVDADAGVVCYPIEDTLAMVAACTSRELVCVLLMLDAGLRAGEVCGLRWDAVDLTARQVTVRTSAYRAGVNSPKSGKARTVPMTRRLTEALRGLYRRGDEWVFPAQHRTGAGSYNTLEYQLRRVCRHAGVEHRGCHALRHTYATTSLRVGVDLRTLQDRLGHSEISVTAMYLHPAGMGERLGVDALEGRLQTPPSVPATVTDLTLARIERLKKQ